MNARIIARSQPVALLPLPISTRLAVSAANRPWLLAMESAIQTVHDRYVDAPNASGTTLLMALRDVARSNLIELYGRDRDAMPGLNSYLLGEPKHVGGFGEARAPRVQGDNHAIHCTHFNTKYAPHREKLVRAINTFGAADFFPAHSPRFEDVGRGYTATYILRGQAVQLTEIFLSRGQGRLKTEWSPMMRCISVQEIPQALEILDHEVSLWHATSADAPHTQRERLGRIHWAASHAWPFERGSAALADMLTKLLADMRGVSLANWRPGVEPNIEALITPDISLFARSYPHLFTTP